MSQTLVRPDAGAVVEVHDLRGAAAPSLAPPVLHDPSGRRAARIRAGARAVVGLLLAWMAGLLLAGLGLLPATIIPFGFLVSAPAPPPLVAMTGAQSASDGRPGATSAVGIVLSTAAAVSANDFGPLAESELEAIGIARPRAHSGQPDPRGARSPAAASSPAGVSPGDEAPRGGDRPPAPSPAGASPRPDGAEPRPEVERPAVASPTGPGAGNGIGGDRPNTNEKPANAGGGTSNAGGGSANAGGNGNAGVNANPGGSNAGGTNAGGNTAGGAGANGNANASGGGETSNSGGHANPGGAANASAKGGGNGDAPPSNGAAANPGGNGDGKSRGRGAAS